MSGCLPVAVNEMNKVTKIKETSDAEIANALLASGWVLLGVCCAKGIYYCLGIKEPIASGPCGQEKESAAK